MDIIDFCQQNGLDYNQGSIVKYVCSDKDKLENLKKAMVHLERMIEFEENKIAEQKERDISAQLEAFEERRHEEDSDKSFY